CNRRRRRVRSDGRWMVLGRRLRARGAHRSDRRADLVAPPRRFRLMEGSQAVEQSLTGRSIHDDWEARYRTPENLRFGEEAIDRVVRLAGASPGAKFLDAR